MKTHSEVACENFRKGYNCAQSVLLAYAEEYGIDDIVALKLSSSFGGGMGRLREVCGAVSAIFMVAGLEHGYIENNNDEIKAAHYAYIQNLAHEFKQKHGTIVCRELLGLEGEDNPIPSKRTQQYYTQRPCETFIKDVCEIFDSMRG